MVLMILMIVKLLYCSTHHDIDGMRTQCCDITIIP